MLVFTATLGAMMCFSNGHWVAGGLASTAWVILFIVTSLDNVRIEWFERAADAVIVEVAKLTQRSGGIMSPAKINIPSPADGVDTPVVMGETEHIDRAHDREG